MRTEVAGTSDTTVAAGEPGPTVVEEITVSDAGFDIPESFVRRGSTLAELAGRADVEAIRQSTAAFEVASATSEAAAVRTQWYPQIQPIASVDSDGESRVGVGARQQVWDFGRTRAEINGADASIRVSEVNFWIERNEAVFTALDAYLDAQVSRRRLAEYSTLLASLSRLQTAVEQRSSGGVGGRGEFLDIDVAIRRAERTVLEEEVDLRTALSIVSQSLGAASDAGLPVGSIGLADCSITESQIEPPELQLARLNVIQSGFQRDAVLARRFPTVVANASIDTSGDTAAGLSLDASDLLGWDRRARVEAAEQTARGAMQNYIVTERNIEQSIQELDLNLASQRAILPQLRQLVSAAEESEAVFWDLFDSGQVQITEGVRLAEERSDANIAVSDLETEIVRTCLRIARIRGSLIEASLGTQ